MNKTTQIIRKISLNFDLYLAALHMKNIQHDKDMNDMEEGWWPSEFSEYAYHELPESSRWLCRLNRRSDSDEWYLEVVVSERTYIFSRCYLPIFILLDIHQLSSLAASKIPAGKASKPHFLKTVLFVNQLRLHLLGQSELHQTQNEAVEPLLKRCLLRIMHGLSHSTRSRAQIHAKLTKIYEEFEGETRWKKGVKLFYDT